MPQAGSFLAIAANSSLAFSYQKEWSIATARLNCSCTVASHETGKFTLPSFSGSPAGCSCCSCWATTDVGHVKHAHAATRHEKPGNLIRADPKMLSTGCANKQIVKSAAGIRRIYRFAFSIVILFSTLNSNGQTIFVADAHRDDEKRFV